MRSRLGTVMFLGAFLSVAGCSESSPAAPRESAQDSIDPSEPPDSSTEATAKPSASEPPPTADELHVTWEEPQPFDGQPSEIVADGDTWIAAGWDPVRGPAAWTSTDGLSWTAAEVENSQPDETFIGPRLGPTVRLGDSLLSFGTFIGGGDGRGVYGWRSADGTAWEAIESDSPLFEQGYLVLALAADEREIVAVETQYAEFSGRIWRWTQETSWIETTPDAGSGQPSGIQPNAVVSSGDRFVAVGTRGDLSQFPSPFAATAWVSEDGQTWLESAPTAEHVGVRFSVVAPLPGGGYAALGYVQAPQAAPEAIAFTSPDGLTWTTVENAFSAPRFLPTDLVWTDAGVVAFGMAPGETTAVWTTTDGESWTDAGTLKFPVQDAAVRGSDVLALTADFVGGTGWRVHRGHLSP